MKNILRVLFITMICSFLSYGQVSNLLVNGVSNNFTGVSGAQFGWSYGVPNAGDTTLIQIWIDTDNNGTLNTSVDVLWNSFIQIDGDPKGQNGPPDIDGTVNSQVSFQQNLGLAPAHYILYFKNNNAIALSAGLITALASPTFTISGRVTNGGTGVHYAVLNLESQSGSVFWTGITDANGDYSIQMSSDTTGNPWKVKIDNKTLFGTSVVSPDKISLTLDAGVKTTYAGNDFTVQSSSSSITGTLRNESGTPIVGADVHATASNNTIERSSTTDTAGVYKIGFLSSELPLGQFNVGSGDTGDTTFVVAQFSVSSLNSGVNLVNKDLKIFKTNSTITGRVTLNGAAPGYSMPLYASNVDTGFSQTMTDVDGNFRFKVSDKIFNYILQYSDAIAQNYVVNNVVMHAGDTNINVNLVSTGIESDNTTIPVSYTLSQNYPNPFNPSTIIMYEIPKESHVTLGVYNILGQKVAELVNTNQAAGRYSVDFNAAKLSSGIYFYKIQAGNFASFRKMILMK